MDGCIGSGSYFGLLERLRRVEEESGAIEKR